MDDAPTFTNSQDEDIPLKTKKEHKAAVSFSLVGKNGETIDLTGDALLNTLIPNLFITMIQNKKEEKKKILNQKVNLKNICLFAACGKLSQSGKNQILIYLALGEQNKKKWLFCELSHFKDRHSHKDILQHIAPDFDILKMTDRYNNTTHGLQCQLALTSKALIKQVMPPCEQKCTPFLYLTPGIAKSQPKAKRPTFYFCSPTCLIYWLFHKKSRDWKTICDKRIS